MFQQTIHEFPVQKEPNPPPWGRSLARDKSSRAVRQGGQRKFKIVDEDSHSTDLSVSGEEGHSTILLAHYVFWFQLRTKCFNNAGYAAKFHKNAQKSYFCSTICIFQHQTQKRFCFLENLLSNFRQKKQLLIVFCATFEQFFEKIRETFWKISSNFRKALFIPVVYHL